MYRSDGDLDIDVNLNIDRGGTVLLYPPYS